MSHNFTARRSAVNFHVEKSTGPKLLAKPVQRYAPFGTFGLGINDHVNRYFYHTAGATGISTAPSVIVPAAARIIDVPPEGVDLRFIPSNQANNPVPNPNPNVNPAPVPVPVPVPGPPQPLPPATMGCKSRADCTDPSKPYCYRGGCVQCILREHCLSGYEYCAPPGICVPQGQPQCLQ